jgi:hypothetical protein
VAATGLGARGGIVVRVTVWHLKVPGGTRSAADIVWVRFSAAPAGKAGLAVGRWQKGERTVQFLIDRGRLEPIEASDLGALAGALIERATRRAEATATAALELGDVDGAYAAAYDPYRIAAEVLLARQGLRATGGEGSHVAVEDTVAAQFSDQIPAFAKPVFERIRRTRHMAQYFDPSAAPITASDARWAIENATAAVAGVKVLLSASPFDRFG